MPYFVFEINVHPETGAKRLTHLETYPKYRDAKNRVKAEREANPETDTRTVRLVFARNQAEAEKLLTTPREGQRIINED
ncbi:MAG TPA: hypothetical protein ENJ73_03520 [Desulfobacterales bacterium]|nr:hypothetical protein [Desulfobacterales bacterium]